MTQDSIFSFNLMIQKSKKFPETLIFSAKPYNTHRNISHCVHPSARVPGQGKKCLFYGGKIFFLTTLIYLVYGGMYLVNFYPKKK